MDYLRVFKGSWKYKLNFRFWELNFHVTTYFYSRKVYFDFLKGTKKFVWVVRNIYAYIHQALLNSETTCPAQFCIFQVEPVDI